MMGYQEVRFGRRWRTKVVAEVRLSEKVVGELTSTGGRAGQYATGWSRLAHLFSEMEEKGIQTSAKERKR